VAEDIYGPKKGHRLLCSFFPIKRKRMAIIMKDGELVLLLHVLQLFFG